MAKLVSQVRPAQYSAAPTDEESRPKSANSPLAAVFGSLLILALVVGAVYMLMSAFGLQRTW
ncbi:MAG TPA: hypothetical protein VF600_18670 [Abditibacteriaceae bacterium]|jgi:flagellar biogenesis protein FliO